MYLTKAVGVVKYRQVTRQIRYERVCAFLPINTNGKLIKTSAISSSESETSAVYIISVSYYIALISLSELEVGEYLINSPCFYYVKICWSEHTRFHDLTLQSQGLKALYKVYMEYNTCMW